MLCALFYIYFTKCFQDTKRDTTQDTKRVSKNINSKKIFLENKHEINQIMVKTFFFNF